LLVLLFFVYASQQTVGIGQLFRHLDTLPQFTLMNAGRGYCDSSIETDSSRNSDETAKGIWRLYELNSKDFSCRIKEEFVDNLFELATLCE
jgi:hypothetical protein